MNARNLALAAAGYVMPRARGAARWTAGCMPALRVLPGPAGPGGRGETCWGAARAPAAAGAARRGGSSPPRTHAVQLRAWAEGGSSASGAGAAVLVARHAPCHCPFFTRVTNRAVVVATTWILPVSRRVES